ncbi:hypothetical protein PRIPAC_88946 [Pristionchus pacificus]|uniref:Uncharacterized protein n=1 Tax=Pristionchus pacificus TaxID=54126 RepID=A0A2A6CX79_PRIPA|nr:hypothetical protein PRIPAC_88946 [Pristionchus pacificus]|eukprot:PDM82700.1 hypothetical protein PRIPAC_37093 [Pristionchus pacificus]
MICEEGAQELDRKVTESIPSEEWPSRCRGSLLCMDSQGAGMRLPSAHHHYNTLRLPYSYLQYQSHGQFAIFFCVTTHGCVCRVMYLSSSVPFPTARKPQVSRVKSGPAAVGEAFCVWTVKAPACGFHQPTITTILFDYRTPTYSIRATGNSPSSFSIPSEEWPSRCRGSLLCMDSQGAGMRLPSAHHHYNTLRLPYSYLQYQSHGQFAIFFCVTTHGCVCRVMYLSSSVPFPTARKPQVSRVKSGPAAVGEAFCVWTVKAPACGFHQPTITTILFDYRTPTYSIRATGNSPSSFSIPSEEWPSRCRGSLLCMDSQGAGMRLPSAHHHYNTLRLPYSYLQYQSHGQFAIFFCVTTHGCVCRVMYLSSSVPFPTARKPQVSRVKSGPAAVGEAFCVWTVKAPACGFHQPTITTILFDYRTPTYSIRATGNSPSSFSIPSEEWPSRCRGSLLCMDSQGAGMRLPSAHHHYNTLRLPYSYLQYQSHGQFAIFFCVTTHGCVCRVMYLSSSVPFPTARKPQVSRVKSGPAAVGEAFCVWTVKAPACGFHQPTITTILFDYRTPTYSIRATGNSPSSFSIPSEEWPSRCRGSLLCMDSQGAGMRLPSAHHHYNTLRLPYSYLQYQSHGQFAIFFCVTTHGCVCRVMYLSSSVPFPTARKPQVSRVKSGPAAVGEAFCVWTVKAPACGFHQPTFPTHCTPSTVRCYRTPTAPNSWTNELNPSMKMLIAKCAQINDASPSIYCDAVEMKQSYSIEGSTLFHRIVAEGKGRNQRWRMRNGNSTPKRTTVIKWPPRGEENREKEREQSSTPPVTDRLAVSPDGPFFPSTKTTDRTTSQPFQQAPIERESAPMGLPLMGAPYPKRSLNEKSDEGRSRDQEKRFKGRRKDQTHD